MSSNQPEIKVDNEKIGYSSDDQFPSQSTIDSEQRQQLEEELAKTEEEIQTLRQVLAARVKHANELKRKLGLGVWKELQSDLQQSIKNVQETLAYQKTTETVKLAAEKTTDIFGSLGNSIGRKLAGVKNSPAFKSFEEKVGSAVGNVKTESTTMSSPNESNNIS